MKYTFPNAFWYSLFLKTLVNSIFILLKTVRDLQNLMNL